MSATQYEVGQNGTLEVYPSQGVPSSASVVAYTAGSSTLFASEAVTPDTASQAVSNVSKGDRTVTVTDASDFQAGRRYWLADDYGTGYEVRCIGKTATSIALDQPVRAPITSGTIKGHGLRRTLTETGTVYRRVRLVWTYTVDGVEHRSQGLFDIVRMPWDLQVTEEDVEAADPTMGEVVGKYKGWEKVRDRAIRDVANYLRGHQVVPDLCRERHMLQDAAVYRTLQLLSIREQSTGAGGSAFTRWGKLYEDCMQTFLGGHHWYDRDDDLVAAMGGTRTIQVGDDTYTVNDGEGSDYLPGGARSETLGVMAYKLRVT